MKAPEAKRREPFSLIHSEAVVTQLYHLTATPYSLLPMPISLSVLRSELREHLGVDALDLPDPDADLLLNRSWWEIMNKFDFREKESSWTPTIVAGTRVYTCPVTQEAVQGVFVDDPNTGERIQLERQDRAIFEERYNSNTWAQGMPTAYTRVDDTILFDPVPDQVYTITVHHLAILSDIPSIGVDAPQEWHELVLFGGVYRGFLRMGLHNRAKAIRKEQTDMIASTVPVRSKEEADSSMAGLQVANYRTNY